MKKTSNKVAIFTFIKANNYGAMLQAYALGRFLKENGFSPVYIDINLKKKQNGIRGWIRDCIINLRFNRFRKKYFSLISENEASILDTFIYGSDQIWNVDIVKDNLSLFSGGTESTSATKIAYAASFGVDSIDKNQYNGFSERLNGFSSIMVRENSAVTILRNEFDINSMQVLDPTFLINNYKNITKLTKNIGICCYLFSEVNRDYKSLEKFSINIGEKLYFLNQTKSAVGIPISFPSVENWLSTVINSKYVITDSFHCMVLALLHGVNFYVLSARTDRFVRISSLLENLGLENRILKSVSELTNPNFKNENIDYAVLNKRLSVLKENSRKLLLDSLNINKSEKL